MGYFSLPYKPTIAKIPENQKYIVISLVDEASFHPRGKKFTREERQKNKETVNDQKRTLEILDNGHYNLFNNPIEPRSILDSFSPDGEEYFTKNIVYRIEPTSSSIYSNSGYYSHPEKYRVYEFDVKNKITNYDDFLKQLYRDGILCEYTAKQFNHLCYANEGYSDKLYAYFVKILNMFPKDKTRLSDIVITYDYKHSPTSKFMPNDSCNSIAKSNVKRLLDDGLIAYTDEKDYFQEDVVCTLINSGMSDIAYDYLTKCSEWSYKTFNVNEDIGNVLKTHSDEYIDKIIKLTGVKLSGVVLKIERSGEYGEGDMTSEKRFENVNDIKTYLIKEYDVPFERVNANDISTIEYSDGSYSYTFTIK